MTELLDDFDELQQRGPAGQQGAPGGMREVGGVDLEGMPTPFTFEERGRYRGLILAGLERARKTLFSRFLYMIGGFVSSTGEVAASEEADDGTAQRVLVDEHGRLWARLPAGVVNWIQEQTAIVGEDARQVPLQRLIVGKEITRPVTLAASLAASLWTVAYASLATTLPVQIDRAKRVTLRVTYTPGESGARLLLYPQITLGESPEVWGFVSAQQDALTPLSGLVNPASLARQSAGYFAEDPFAAFTTTAATPIVATFTLDDYPALNALRFALRDTALTTAGTATIIVTQE